MYYGLPVERLDASQGAFLRGGQDRNHRRLPFRLVHRLHPATRHLCRPLPRGLEPPTAAVPGRCRWPPEGVRRRHPHRDLDPRRGGQRAESLPVRGLRSRGQGKGGSPGRCRRRRSPRR
ncbi:hypothetical protein ACFWA5_01000 [Streptomyces mirabilis]|uniref:hypothetical protein n=1 Tax=Streptomyces mirabilis TaxID=68239 RepID=UPI0036478D3A